MIALTTQKLSMLSEQPASWSMAARDLYPLICVRDPYFAFQTFDVQSDIVTSTVAAEHPMLAEAGPIAAAEAGRHLAILGSCAAAMNNPTRARHYYLAREAYLERANSALVAPSLLTCNAEADFADKRTARANCAIFARDEKLFTLDVSYSVLSEALFTRFYGKHGSEVRNDVRDNVTPLQRVNPYRSTNPLEILESDDSKLRASLGVITKEMCAGHFPGYPCLPVAALMHCLSNAAGALFLQRTGERGYVVQIAEVAARELAFAGTSLQLEASYVGGHARGEKFNVRAVSDAGAVIGELGIVLEGSVSRGPVPRSPAPPSSSSLGGASN